MLVTTPNLIENEATKSIQKKDYKKGTIRKMVLLCATSHYTLDRFLKGTRAFSRNDSQESSK